MRDHRRILITGASKGLGAVLCQSFPDDEVIPYTRNECDFLKLDQWNHDLSVDVAIHCAGGGLGLRDPDPSSRALYDLFMTNLGGAAEINRVIMPGMKVNGWGRIVHVCSIASGEAVGSVGYNMVKSGLAAYVRSLGREMAHSGIVVSGIAPGAFQAPGNAMERLKMNHPEAYMDFLTTRLPRKKMGDAAELVPLIRFLCSDDASMMAGCVVPIDAGEGIYY